MRQSNRDTLSDVIVHEERYAYTPGKEVWGGVYDVPNSINLTIKTELFVCGKLGSLRLSVWVWLIRTHMSFPFLSHFLPVCIDKQSPAFY